MVTPRLPAQSVAGFSRRLAVLILVGVAIGHPTPRSPAPRALGTTGGPAARALEWYGQLPLGFEVNEGQAAAEVRFLARGSNYSVFLTEQMAAFSFKEHAGRRAASMHMKLVNANRAARITAGRPLPGKQHYFKGATVNWRTNVTRFAEVRYDSVYPGIDLVFYGRQRALEYDFIVAPGADPRRIELAFEGADSPRVEPSGDLILQVGDAQVRQQKPLVYQDSSEGRRIVQGGYRLLPEGRVGFDIAGYNETLPLVIDPIVVYSSYFGGGALSQPLGGDQGSDVAVDDQGCAYITGAAYAADFPTTPGAVQTVRSGDSDAFVAKVSADGSTLIYSTLLGGASHENYFVGGKLAVDGAGNAYVTGETHSETDFPTTPGAFRRSGGSVFVAKLNPSGSALVYSTLIGNGQSQDIAIDVWGQVYLTGLRLDRAFPTRNPLMATLADSGGFVVKLNASGSDLVFSTYLGGSGGDSGNEFDRDQGTAIAVDHFGHVYVGGRASSRDFPVVNAAQPQHAGATLDGFIAKIDASGGFLHYLTYLGGAARDGVTGIAVGLDSTVHVAGFTASGNFPEVNPLPDPPPANFDAFVTRFSASGSTFLFSTRIGGPDVDSAGGIALDAQGNIFVVGSGNAGFPQVRALGPGFGSGIGGDAFIVKLARGGTSILYSTYLGGDNLEWGAGIAVDRSGAAYVAGSVFNGPVGTFPIVGGFQPTPGGGIDAYVAKITDPVACPDEITNRVQVTRFGLHRLFLTPIHFEWVVITNVSAEPMAGPLALAVLDVQNAAFIGSSRTTTCFGAARTGYGVVPVYGDAVLAPGESVLTGVWFYQASEGPVTYATRVLSAVPLQ